MTIKVASKLDRVQMQILIPESAVVAVKKGFEQLCGKYLVAPEYTFGPKIQTMHARFFINYGEAAMRVRLSKIYKKNYIKYDFNPNNLSSNELRKFINLSQSMCSASYPNVLEQGKLARFEIAVDYLNVHTSGHLFHRPYATNFKYLTNPKQYGGTYYFGSKDSALQLTIYDKSEEQQAAGKPIAFSKLLRIEARCAPTHVTVHELDKLPNHFAKLVVCSFAELQKIPYPSEPAIWNLFLKRAYIYGAKKALQAVPMVHRKSFTNMLKSNQASWWSPDTILNGFPHRAKSQLQLEFAKSVLQ